MRYKCFCCDAIFSEDEAGSYTESRGEFWGVPCYETLMCCPECRSDDIEEYYGEDDEEEEEEDDKLTREQYYDNLDNGYTRW